MLGRMLWIITKLLTPFRTLHSKPLSNAIQRINMNTEQWQELINTFGDAANHIYQAAAQQALFEAITAAIAIVAVLVIGLSLVISYKIIKPKMSRNSIEGFYGAYIGIGVIYIIFGFGILITCSIVVLNYVVNPDWMILRIISVLIQ